MKEFQLNGSKSNNFRLAEIASKSSPNRSWKFWLTDFFWLNRFRWNFGHRYLPCKNFIWIIEKKYKYLYFIKFYRNIVFKKFGVETTFNLIQSTQSATWSDPLPSVHISTAAVGDLFLSESLTERWLFFEFYYMEHCIPMGNRIYFRKRNCF